MVKLKALNIPDVSIKELGRIPNKDEIFEVTEERAKALTTSDNAVGEPVAVLYEEPKKAPTTKKTSPKKATSTKKTAKRKH